MTPQRPGSSRALALLAAVAILLWLGLCMPLLVGEETLYFRDVFLSHLPFKAFGAEALRQGTIPAFNPTWALGQPFRGNPNTLAFYPGNLVYLVLPFWPAFNLHYCLHWLLAGLGMVWLARQLGMSRAGAFLAGVTYAGSGFMLAAMTFYNVLTVVAWWPLAILGAVRGGRRGIALGGLACGMALLGGEPVTAAVGLAPLAALAVQRHGGRRGAATVLAVAVGGALVALPQIVASLRVAGFSFRGAHGVLASQASYYSLEPERLLELLVPFPFGYPGYHGPAGLESTGVLDHLPYFFSLHFGIVATALAVGVARRRPLLAALAASGLILAWLGGLSGRALLLLSGGFFRSPEKLLFWFALALPLLAGMGLESVGSRIEARSLSRWLLVAAGIAAAALAIVLFGGTDLVAGLLEDPASAAAQWRLWRWGLLIAVLLLAASAVAVRRGSAEVLLGLQLLALLQLLPLWMTDQVEPYRQPPWSERVAAGTSVVPARMAYPAWEMRREPPVFAPGAPRSTYRFQALELAPAPGLLHGLGYPLAPDLEGMHHLFYDFLTVRMATASWRERSRWLAVVGAELLVAPEAVPEPGLELAGVLERYGTRSFVHRVRDPAPAAWWPATTRVAPSPAAAFESIGRSPPGSLPGLVPQPFAHHPGGKVEVLAIAPDRIELAVESDGGLAVVRRSFQPLWRAWSGGRELPVVPANLCLLGVVVPAGKHQVVVTASAGPEKAAAAVAAVWVIALLGMLAVPRKRALE